MQIGAIRHYIGTIGLIQHLNWFESRSCDLVTTTTISFLNINTWLKRHSLITSALRKEPRPPSGCLRSTLVTLESPFFFLFSFFQRQEQVFALITRGTKAPRVWSWILGSVTRWKHCWCWLIWWVPSAQRKAAVNLNCSITGTLETSIMSNSWQIATN